MFDKNLLPLFGIQLNSSTPAAQVIEYIFSRAVRRRAVHVGILSAYSVGTDRFPYAAVTAIGGHFLAYTDGWPVILTRDHDQLQG